MPSWSGGDDLAYTVDGPDGLSGPPQVVVSHASHGGHFGPTIPLPSDEGLADPWLAEGPMSTWISATRIGTCEELRCWGQPVAWMITGSGEAVPVGGTVVPAGKRASYSAIAPLGRTGAALMTYELQDHSGGSEIFAVRLGSSGSGRPRRLSKAAAGSARVWPIGHDHVVVVWPDKDGLHTVLVESDGRYASLARPTSPPRVGADRLTEPGLAGSAAGDDFVVAWQVGHELRVAIKQFGRTT
jgi:hypothetical protein